ncbi:Cobalamin-binding radical SAM protein [Desulfonema limicola]|uniref:Cobalamin-binding radical SAM protein n=1 Tax=Desulfonema limicola TaxID=45656 RepID=A0A975GH14_9BACT|nr:lipid biosynthesis B12-binding/radical SAM protein [Desulfonema limicola]QTA80804.1 Cobalamin-binding radical SAM protein [Desulfonema limicola]
MKVLLISTNTLTVPYPVYPLGLDYVAHAVSDFHQVKIADMNQAGSCKSLGDLIDEFSPDIIGLSLRNIDNTDTSDPRGFIGQYQETARVVRKHSRSPLILGGSGFTIFPDEIMNALDADYGIIGEGERLILLLDAIEKNEDISSIPGIITRNSGKKIPAPWNRAFAVKFDPDASYLDFYLNKGGMLNLQTRRGCSFQCIYCTYPHIEGRVLRPVAPEQAAAAALKLQKAGARYFFITDSAFNADYKHSTEVALAFKKAKISIPWGAFFAPVKPPPDYYKILADAGLTHVEFGTEALSEKMLKSYKKPFSIEHVLISHQAALDAGLYSAHYFLFGGPGEDINTLNQTLVNIEKLNKAVFFFFCGMRIYPHTALYDIALNEGQITKEQNLLEPVFYHSKSISSKDIINHVKNKAENRANWVIGAGGDKTADIVSRMYEKGFSGPLWEYLIQ